MVFSLFENRRGLLELYTVILRMISEIWRKVVWELTLPYSFFA